MAREKNPARVEAAKKNPWILYMKSSCAVRYKQKKNRLKKKKAATNIQRMFRGHAARKQVKAMKVKAMRERQKAAQESAAQQPVAVPPRRSTRKVIQRKYLRDEQ